MRNPLKRLPNTDPKPTLRERAASLKASAKRAIHSRPTPDADQPQSASLPEASPLEQAAPVFPATDIASQDSGRGYSNDLDRDRAASGQAPRSETIMGRHETFHDAVPLASNLLASTAALISPKTSAEAGPNARGFAVEQAAAIDLSGLSIMQLGALFDRFETVASLWNAELHLPYANESKTAFRVNTAAGDLAEGEQERAAQIRDRIVAEIDRRRPTDRWDANAQLETLIRHELMCNGDLRDPAIRARIEATWGDAPAPDAKSESVVRQPEPEFPVPSTLGEAELITLVSEYEGFARATNEASDREDVAGFPRSNTFENAIDRARHFTNQGRESAIRHAMALPTTSLLGFGLKAQILEHNGCAAWGEYADDADIMLCRALLRGLIAAAGLSPIRWPEVTPDEIRGWLADPSTAPGAKQAGA